jgi:hypothetical protein
MTSPNEDAMAGLPEVSSEKAAPAKPKRKRAPRKAKAAAQKTAPRRVIVIDEEEGKPNYEVVGVNGKVYQIQRGIEVAVPEEVIGVLNNAVASRLVQVKLPDGRVDRQLRKYQSIPFRIVR